MKSEVNVRLSKWFEKQFTDTLYNSGVHRALRVENSKTVSAASADFAAVMRDLLAKSKIDDFSVRWRYFNKDDLTIGGTGYDKTFLIYPKTDEENFFYLPHKASNTLFVFNDKSFGLIASLLACEILLKRYHLNDSLKYRMHEVLVAYIAIHDAFSIAVTTISSCQFRFDVLEKESLAAIKKAFDVLVDENNEIVERYNVYGDYQPVARREYPKFINYLLKRKGSQIS